MPNASKTEASMAGAPAVDCQVGGSASPSARRRGQTQRYPRPRSIL